MSHDDMLTEMHTIIKQWEAHGFPLCTKHVADIETLQWRTKLIIGTLVVAGLAVAGGCL